jgi:hypothetical protein
VLKPSPSPIPDGLFPPPLHIGGAGRVPLPEPVFRVKADGLEIKFTVAGGALGPVAGQTMTLNWTGRNAEAKTVTFTAAAVPANVNQVPTALAGETVQEYSFRFAQALASNPVLSSTFGGDFAVVAETSDATGDYVRLMYQNPLAQNESGLITAVENMANITAASTARAIAGRYQSGLPIGMTFNVRNGGFAGTPSINGDYEVTVYATNIFDWAPAPLLPRLTPPLGYPTAPPELITPGQPLSVFMKVDDTAWSWQTFRTNYFTNAELFDPNISGENADPDGDGISNAYEYAAGSNPREPDLLDPSVFVVPYGVQTDETAGTITLFWTADTTATEATMKLQTSTDMLNWTDLPNPEPQVFGVLDFFTFQATAVPGEIRFYRLKPVITAP